MACKTGSCSHCLDPDICIIDLEDARLNTGEQYGLAGSNQYRAPEVTLGTSIGVKPFGNWYSPIASQGIRWNDRIDSFSVGCVLAELWKRDALFPFTDNIAERLLAIECILESLPPSLAARVVEVSGCDLAVEGSRTRMTVSRTNVRQAIRYQRIKRSVTIHVSLFMSVRLAGT